VEGIKLRYLITGGAGFIGSHAAEYLLGKGHSVVAIDDLSTGSMDNLQSIRGHKEFQLVVESVLDSSRLGELIGSADVVLHLAASVGVFKIIESPVRTIHTNIQGTEIVLSHAARLGKRTLVASTSEVYGKSSKLPFSEDDDCVLGPSSRSRWSYAASKLVDEFLALSYFKEKKVPIVVVRFFNTVGPRQTGHYGMVLPRFVRQALDGGPITVFGDGQQSRCFGYVGDVVQAMVRLVEEPSAFGKVFNIGNDQEMSIVELATLVRDRVNPSVKIVQVPYDKAYEAGFEDMRRRVPDLSRIRDLIDYKPSRTVSQIVDEVIHWERQHEKGSKSL
jgi:UDP-glucose 4-epimerase